MDRSRESGAENLVLVEARNAAVAVPRSMGPWEHIGSHKVAQSGAKSAMSAVAYAVSVALAGSYAPAAFAQHATADLEEIIVTARKREETLLEIPQEVHAISQREMERANINTLEDLQRFVPS